MMKVYVQVGKMRKAVPKAYSNLAASERSWYDYSESVGVGDLCDHKTRASTI